MIVNNINLVNKYGITVLSHEFGNSKVTNYIDWLESANTPTKLKDSKFTFDSLDTIILVEGSAETEVLKKISDILLECKEGNIKFSDLDFYANCVLDNSENKRICSNAYELTMQFKVNYKYTKAITKEFSSTSFTINNAGNAEIPCIVEITSKYDYGDLVITGLADSKITIKAITANKTIRFNYDSVLQNGINKFNDVDMWQFPRLKVGNNNITLSREHVTIKLYYKERMI